MFVLTAVAALARLQQIAVYQRHQVSCPLCQLFRLLVLFGSLRARVAVLSLFLAVFGRPLFAVDLCITFSAY